MIEIFLAGVPMGKQRIRTTREGRVYTPGKTVSFEGRLAYAAQEVMAERPLLDGPLVVEIVVLLPIPKSRPRAWQDAARAGEIRPTKKPDFDNFSKMIDALNMVVWTDDAIIVTGTTHKFYADKPLFAIRIRAAGDDDRATPSWALALAAKETGNVFT